MKNNVKGKNEKNAQKRFLKGYKHRLWGCFIAVFICRLNFYAGIKDITSGFWVGSRGFCSGLEAMKKKRIWADKKASGDFSFFLAFAFLLSFCIRNFNSNLIRSKKGGSNELGKLRCGAEKFWHYLLLPIRAKPEPPKAVIRSEFNMPLCATYLKMQKSL